MKGKERGGEREGMGQAPKYFGPEPSLEPIVASIVSATVLVSRIIQLVTCIELLLHLGSFRTDCH